jgi:peptide/histidine transporter 3/4
LNRSRLDYFYLLLAGLSAANFVFFLFCAHWYQYKKVNRVLDDDATQDGSQIEIKGHEQLEGDAFI